MQSLPQFTSKPDVTKPNQIQLDVFYSIQKTNMYILFKTEPLT